MFLPIGDTPNPHSRPVMTYLLIGINVAVFLLITLPQSGIPVDINDPMLAEYLRSRGVTVPLLKSDIEAHISAYDMTVWRYGFRPGSPSLLSLLTAMFLHGGFMHLAGNMLFLYIYGDNVEARLGRFRYLLAYLATGIASTLFFSLFTLGSQIPLVGASGAISGLLGLYFIWFPKNRVKIFVFLFPILITTLLVPARLVLGFYLLIENLLPFLLASSAGGGVAYGAHIGGFLAGAAVAWKLGKPGKSRATAEPSAPTPITTPVERVEKAYDAGNRKDAAARFLQLTDMQDRKRVDPMTVLGIASVLRRQGQADAALSVLRRFLADNPSSPYLGHAYLALGQMLAGDPRTRTSAHQHFLSAIDVSNDPKVIDEARHQLRQLSN